MNQLGVGLHSYGFTSGIATALNAFYVCEVVLVLAALARHAHARNHGVAPA